MIRPNFKQGEKIEVIINNEKKDFKRKKEASANNSTYTDEIEAAHSTTINSLRNWIIKNYICQDYLSKMVIEDYKKNVKPEIEVFYFFLNFFIKKKIFFNHLYLLYRNLYNKHFWIKQI